MASADVPVERTMFVRKATGLVKGWSVFDAFIYSALSINLITLGFGYAFTGVAVLPTLTILGFTGTSAFHADWWAYSKTDGNGIFFTSILTAVLASVIIALGMRTYARIQKYCFYGGMVGLVLMILIFL